MKKPLSGHAYGFSLIELLVTLAVVGIGLSITVPAMRDFTNSNQQTEQISKLMRDITYAKSEAVTRGKTVTISQLSTTAGNWQEGWQVMDGSTVLKTTPKLNGGSNSITLTEASAISAITFKSSGSANTATSFNLCDTKTDINNTDKQLTVSLQGHTILNTKFNCP